MAVDIYAQDTCQMRYHLVHMVVELMPKFDTVAETVTMLEALSAYIKAGNPVPDDKEDDDPKPGKPEALDPRGYL